jgi:glucoamylase
MVCSASVLYANSDTIRAMPLEKWLPLQEKIALKNLVRNISPPGTVKGAVVASPSKQDPDYWFHWVRDAALVMSFIVEQYTVTTNSEQKGFYLDLIWDYIQFSKTNQLTANPSGGPGEPKFNVDGSAFVGPWGRPQNDGPALRAITLIQFAKALIQEGKVEDQKRLSSIIKYDLEYVSHHWKDASFDLWEEIKGHHFYTLMVQHRSLVEGANYCKNSGDKAAADWYLNQAQGIRAELQKFWDSSRGYIQSTLNRVGGIDYKKSNIDSSVILAVLHAAASDHIFGVDDARVQATLLKTKQVFKSLYSINQSGPAGVAIGRYPEDKYDGYSSAGEGNPWILASNAFAEFYYRLENSYKNKGEISINPTNHAFFTDLGIEVALGTLRKTDPLFERILKRLSLEGDEYLNRVKFHSDSDGQMSEQMNRWSGFLQGARDLTWSYASFLTALRARS